MKVICSYAADCSDSYCSHRVKHTKDGACSAKCYRDINAACVPVEAKPDPSVKPKVTSTSTAANAAPIKKENNEMKKTTLIERVKTAGSTVISKQGELVKTAALLEVSAVMLKQATALIKPTLPIWARGFADTAYFQAGLANALMLGVEFALPDVPEADIRKQAVAAGAVGAYQDIIGSFDLNGMIDNLFNSPEVSKALAKAGVSLSEVKTPKAAKAAKAATEV